MTISKEGPLLLALHSSSDTLGVALQSIGVDAGPPVQAAFPLGRALSNHLLACLESVLPASDWRRLGRLAVATGPGGFTGTRLTVVLARTLAQQLAVPLDGVSSFQLIARRLHRAGAVPDGPPFWLVQELPRHGQVAGLYAADPAACGGIGERLAPRLFRRAADRQAAAADLGASATAELPATPLLPADALELLAFSQDAARRGQPAPWAPVLPLYPTSPVAVGG